MTDRDTHRVIPLMDVRPRGLVGAGSTGTGTARAPGQPEPEGFMQAPTRFESAHGYTRTALCIEARDPRRADDLGGYHRYSSGGLDVSSLKRAA